MRQTTVVVCAFLAFASLSPASAGTYREFGKWAVGCDNARACAAFGISEAERAGERHGLRIAREPGEAGKLRIAFNRKDVAKMEHVVIDGAKRPIAPAEPGTASSSERSMLALVDSLLNASTMTGPDGGTDAEIVSLKGLKAALLYIDEQQGRIGSRNAFVAKGDKATARRPGDYPVVRAVQVSDVEEKRRAALSPQVQKRIMAYHRRTTDRKNCDIGFEPGDEASPEPHPLQPGLTLMEVYCWRAAYQAGSVFYLYDHKSGVVTDPGFEQLDTKTGAITTGKAKSISGADYAKGRIESLHKARGLGGCGVQLGWRWDGRVFRLTSYHQKLLCNHEDAAFRLYRAKIRQPDGLVDPLPDDDDEEVAF